MTRFDNQFLSDNKEQEKFNMPNTVEDYCEEFCHSIVPPFFKSGDWFGSLLAFEYQLVNFFGKTYSQEQFRDKINDGSIMIISISDPGITDVNFGNDINSSGTIKGYFIIQSMIDGALHSGTVNFEHQVKWSIQATKTIFS